MSRKYPNDEQALATFTPEELSEAIAKLADSDASRVTLVSFGKLPAIQPDTMRAFAAMCETIPGAFIVSVYNGTEIVRRMSAEELRESVLNSRKSEMWYTKDSPYYIGEADES